MCGIQGVVLSLQASRFKLGFPDTDLKCRVIGLHLFELIQQGLTRVGRNCARDYQGFDIYLLFRRLVQFGLHRPNIVLHAFDVGTQRVQFTPGVVARQKPVVVWVKAGGT
jgi:hypothetical protein